MESRRSFIKKTLLTAGLTFSGIEIISPAVLSAKGKVKLKHWDVIVVGAGPGGVPAAVSAARNGANVLLIERYGFLGGMATTALVQPYMRFRTHDGGKVIIKGLFKEFSDRLYEGNAVLENRQTFDAEPMKHILDKFVLDSGVNLLLHTTAIGVLKDRKTIKAVRVFHKGGVEDFSADIFVDSSGDGDIAAWAGCEIKTGRDSDGVSQPMTTNFRMANVDIDKMSADEEINRLYDQAKLKGEVTNPRENVLHFKTVHPDVIHFNTTRVTGKSALDGWSLTEAEIEGRRQIDDMVKFLRKYIKGFENSYLMKCGPQIGVRESRRVIGKYILTEDDVLKGRHFDDGIACGAHPVDIHNPTGTGTVIKRLKKGTFYKIPYRCLIPNKTDNLIIASRCISSTHVALSSLRIQPTVWAIGEAGGTASSLCIKKRIKPEEIEPKELRKVLINQGAFV